MRLKLKTVNLSLAFVMAAIPVAGCETRKMNERHEEIAQKGAEVMPFDLERTTHIFEKRDNGGRQQVVSDDGDVDQIELVRMHLEEEAERFSRGDYHDPESIHGHNMPGLHELVMGHDRIHIEYSPIQEGGQIDYSSDDSTLIDAIHQWFDAQLSDHGRHAQEHH